MRKNRCWEVVELIEQKTPNLVFIIQLCVKKICKSENIFVAKFLYKKLLNDGLKETVQKSLAKDLTDQQRFASRI